MGGGRRTDFTASPTKEVPGPGAYSATFFGKGASPKWNLATTGQREFIKVNNTPGPGKYDVKAIDNAPKISLSGWTPSADVKNTPAPNAYNCKFPNKPTASSRSFGYKYDFRPLDADVPGPGKYYKDTPLDAPAPKISKNERGMNKKSPRDDSSPGPGKYDIPNLSVTASTKFAKGGREYLRAIERSSVSPGPGKYDLPGAFKSSRDQGFTIKGKRKDPLPDNTAVPGPGSYPASNTLSTKSFSVGKSFRRPLNDMDKSIPGPGTYEPTASSTIPNWKFGSSQRSELVRSDNPGPGAYFENNKTDEMPPADVPDRGKSNTVDVVHKDNTPGPGAYRPSYDHVWNKNPTFKQGLGPRDPPNDKRSFPGPGQYQTATDSLAGPRYTFGVGLNKHTIRKALFEPGPGSYDMPHTIGAVPKYLLPNGPTKIHF